MDDSLIVDKIKEFCENNNISTNNVLSITIQKNFTSEFTSLHIDFVNNKILPNYPIESDKKLEKEMIKGDFIITYKQDLPIVIFSEIDPKSYFNINEPFCCDQLVPHSSIKLHNDHYFEDFIKKNGTINERIFSITRQQNNGPIIFTNNYKLINGQYIKIEGTFNSKDHSFKNFKCLTHNLYFHVNLYCLRQIINNHHMRVNPITIINQEVLNSFFSLNKINK